MKVTVRLFAMLREEAGTDTCEVELPEHATAADAVSAASDQTGLSAEARTIPVVLAVNREQAQPDTALADGDEVAMLPPVSGGAPARVRAAIKTERLSADRLRAAVADDGAGAIVTFEGVTREVPQLEYDAYVEMAKPLLEALLTEVAAEHGLLAIAAEHRVGTVPLGESSVIIAASSAHRGEAFTGARAAIDRIKVELPIWKQEQGTAGDQWVEGTPMRSPA
jgi:molybdopterin synthase catalytic subunit